MLAPKHKILLVDDHASMRATLRSLLTQYDDIEIVGEACDGKEAITLIPVCRPDIILMDINMPEMNGIEATSVITESWKDPMIIGMCLVDDTYLMDAFLKAGALAVIPKDRFDRLHSTIKRACANRAH